METQPSPTVDLSTLPGRIGALVAWSGAAHAPFGLAAGLSKTHIGQVLRGSIKTLRDDAVAKVADLTGASRAWIAYGEGDAPAEQDVAARVRRRLEERASGLKAA